MNAKKLGVLVLVVAMLVGGVIGVSAQDNPPPQPGQGEGFGFGGGRPGMGAGRGDMGQRGGRGGLGGEHEFFLIQSIMDATGMNRVELAAEVRGGSTLADAITANGGTVEAVVADAVADATTAINEAVTSGRVTQEQADMLIAQLETVYTNMLSGEMRDNAVERIVDGGIVRLAAELTGLDGRDIFQQMTGGASLSSILEANGVTVDAFTVEATERAEALINVRVANGRITEEEAAAQLARFIEELNSVLSATPAL